MSSARPPVNFTDYLSYWAAGKLTLGGEPASAYDVVKHRAMEFTVTNLPAGLLPFPYPPPFLLVVTPFSLLSYEWGFAAWILVTGLIFVAGTRRVADMPFTLGHPAVLMNGLIGQNGLLTCPIFVTGALILRKRPFVAGTILGSLVIKPQLALLLPVAVIAVRLWPAMAGAAVSGALLLVSLALFGLGAFAGFVEILPLYRESMRQDKWPVERIHQRLRLRPLFRDRRVDRDDHPLRRRGRGGGADLDRLVGAIGRATADPGRSRPR